MGGDLCCGATKSMWSAKRDWAPCEFIVRVVQRGVTRAVLALRARACESSYELSLHEEEEPNQRHNDDYRCRIDEVEHLHLTLAEVQERRGDGQQRRIKDEGHRELQFTVCSEA